MKVFVAGGTGAVGARLLPKLTAAGHAVTAITRSADKAEALSEHVSAAVCDVFDAGRLAAVVAAAQPDVVVNQLTDLPQSFAPGEMAARTAAHNRVRSEGTANLLAAATAAGVRRMVAQSVAFWYAPGPGLRTEDDPMWLDGPDAIAPGARVMHGVEQAITSTPGIEAVLLRYGIFYGPGTWYSRSGSSGQDVSRRRQPVVGRGVWSLIHVDDAAQACVAALTGPPGTYNIVDDEPAPMAEWLPVFAQALRAPKPMRAPKLVAKLIAKGGIVDWMDRMPGASNARARTELGWTPAYASWREGFRTL